MIDTSNIAQHIGADVIDSDGEKIGTLSQIFVDPATAVPLWGSIKGGFLSGHDRFAPLADATSGDERIVLAYSKDVVKHAPRIDADGPLTDEDNATLDAYYSRQTPSGSGSGPEIAADDAPGAHEATEDDGIPIPGTPDDSGPRHAKTD